jgi:hypothetical protein
MTSGLEAGPNVADAEALIRAAAAAAPFMSRLPK